MKSTKYKGNKVINSGIWFTVSNFVVNGIGFLTTPIFTRFLSKAEFGEFSNFMTVAGILTIIVSLNLDATLIRARYEFEKTLDSYVLSMAVLGFVSAALWYAAAMIFSEQAEALLSMDKKYIHLMFAYLFFFPAISLFQTSERFKFRYKWSVAVSIAIAVLTSGLSVALIFILPDRLMGRVTGYVSPYIAIGAAVTICFFIKGKKVDVSYWKYAFPIALPFIPHLLSMFLLGSMDRVMIKQLCGSEATAVYSLAYTCGTIISFFLSALNNAFSPWLGEQLNKQDYEAVRRVGTPYAACFTYAACGVILLTPEVLYILGGKNYMEAMAVIPPVAAGCILQFFYCMYVNVEQYEKKTKGMAAASFLAAAMNFILNLIFIPRFGYIAAAYTTYIGYLSLMLMHMLLVKRINRAMVYENGRILLMAAAVSVFMPVSGFLFEHTVLRYIVILLYASAGLAVVYRNRNRIKELFIK